MSALQVWELLSYVVTVVGLPLAIYTFWKEQRKERENETLAQTMVWRSRGDAYERLLRSTRAQRIRRPRRINGGAAACDRRGVDQ
ncbi:MAG TPA: hypothetical protein VM096_02205 [Vicinamibacterales bacterium]|nr:hypothetical protein [Vicinamibacterales bacterium]